MRFVNLHHNHMPPVNSPEYQAFHKAVRLRYGRADDYGCWLCDKQAHDWAWVHDTDPDDTDNYIPLCRWCHKRYDRAEWLKRERAAKRAEGERKGWTPERRVAQSKRAKEQWSDGTLSRSEQSQRAIRDRPWEGRRPSSGGGAR